jgi:hypothetical protein
MHSEYLFAQSYEPHTLPEEYRQFGEPFGLHFSPNILDSEVQDVTVHAIHGGVARESVFYMQGSQFYEQSETGVLTSLADEKIRFLYRAFEMHRTPNGLKGGMLMMDHDKYYTALEKRLAEDTILFGNSLFLKVTDLHARAQFERNMAAIQRNLNQGGGISGDFIGFNVRCNGEVSKGRFGVMDAFVGIVYQNGCDIKSVVFHKSTFTPEGTSTPMPERDTVSRVAVRPSFEIAMSYGDREQRVDKMNEINWLLGHAEVVFE